MATIVKPTAETIAQAAAILRNGGLVAFPTETVYGLGANALDGTAVARIFAAKNRPPTNPLIVHVGTIAAAEAVAVFPEPADPSYGAEGIGHVLARKFWPGPLTLVMRKKPIVPDIATAGGQTVGVRMPAHPVALALLAACEFPLAAPSANRSEQISPTLAEHVSESLGDNVDLILDGGPCSVGLESTVFDITCSPPCILRPGMIGADRLTATIGPILDGSFPAVDGIARAPGAMPRHYAPRTPLILVDADDFWFAVGRFSPDVPALAYAGPGGTEVGGRTYEILPADPEEYAAALYAAIWRLDRIARRRGAACLLVQRPPDSPPWHAVRDRLTRAGGPNRY